MHSRFDELLSHRGEPLAAATRAHVECCAECSATQRQLLRRQQALRELPQFDAPAIGFATVQARAMSAPPLRANHDRWRIAAAIVACVLIGLMAFDRSRQSSPTVVRFPAPAESIKTPETANDATTSPLLPVTQLVAESRALDAVLRQLPPPRQVQRMSFAATVDRLEQRVQWIDVQLSSVPDALDDDARPDELAHQLWRERVDLMDSLVKVRYATSL